MENYDILLNQLQAEILNSKKSVFGGGRAIDEIKCVDLINLLRENMPKDLIEATYVLRDRDDIINSAKTQAREIIDGANLKAKNLVMNSEIVRRASQDADNMVADANEYIARVENETRGSISNVFDEAEDRIAELLSIIRESREEFDRTTFRRKKS